MATTKPLNPLIVIVGETATGKSDLALRLAEKFNGEIICADSWTVRNKLDIGTAKPSSEEQFRITHHLLNVVEPCQDFTAAVYKRLAQEAINDIHSRGKLPIMVGGTGLYIDSVIYDFGFLAPGNRQAREELSSMTLEQLMHKIDELGLIIGDIDVRNKRRLIRLIETNGAIPSRQMLRPKTLILGLKIDRDQLKNRIMKRVDNMFSDGLEIEVLGLSQLYGWDCEGLKGVGYAQWRGYFKGTQSLDQTREKIIKASLDLAKRQRTWFKRDKSIRWQATPVNFYKIVETTTTFLNTPA
ncbi:MAG TPA: tRNA (adenosine(37)-N6)-dimethylallyltransferase MiaA [Candidatus Saccharimonadales bacterium]|nr:tRNA (adenosine(37)-N6)-dimethylallyltransferase MiaA [Candidatus Saccharimonadales bacterium]